MTRSRTVTGFVCAALVLLAAFVWLGLYVTAHGEPPALMSFALAARGKAIGAAWILTNACYPFVLAPLYVIALIAAIAFPRVRLPGLFLVGSGILSWRAVDWLQNVFARPRRTDWLIKHEHAFSYPSSHAAISTGFYFLLGVLLLRSRLASWMRYGAFAFFTLLALAVMWSRLSLAAHYPTDVVGGVLVALAIICLGVAGLKAAGGRLTER